MPFPATYSTLAPDALAAMTATRYGLDRPRCALISRGVGDTYLVESTEGKAILRVYRSTHRSPAQIATELKVLLAAREAGVSVSYPLPDRQGLYMQTLDAIEGPRYAALFTFAEGRSVAQPDAAQARALGREVAKFHKVTEDWVYDGSRWTYDPETTLFGPLRAVKPFFSEYPEGYTWLMEAAERTARVLETFELPQGYIHFDFLPKNFHYPERPVGRDAGDTPTLFDFDFLGFGWFAHDIMSYWQHLETEVFTRRVERGVADAIYAGFLEGYTGERALTAGELGVIPHLRLGFWVFYMGFHTTHDQFLPYLQTGSLRPRVEALKRMIT